jgi:hypothetical protein
MEKMHATTNGRDPQKTIEEIDMEVKGDGPEIMTTMALIAKSPQDTKTTATKEVIEEVQDIEATEKRTIKNPRKRIQRIQPLARRHAQRTLSYTLSVRRWEASIKTCNERLHNIFKLQEAALNKQIEARR